MNGFHLGINLGHDRSAALVHDGEIITAIHQERLDRNKHSVGFLSQSLGDTRRIQLPMEAIRYCLDGAGIELNDVASITANMPGIDYSGEILRRQLDRSLHAKIRDIPSHHLAHAYTAFAPSGFDSAVVLVADATGTTGTDNRTESYSLYRAEGERLELIHAERIPAHLAGLATLGSLYEHVTRRAGFSSDLGGGLHMPEAGKLMGLAPYGGPQPHWRRWIHPRRDSYSLDISPYEIGLELAALERRYDDGVDNPYLRPYLVDLAYKIQSELEEGLLHVVAKAVEETGLRRLCLAGGVGLNSVANYRLLRELELEDLFAFPAAGDAGIAAGCALWAAHQGGDRVCGRPLKEAGLGRDYTAEEIEAALAHYADRLEVEPVDPVAAVERTAEALAKGNIVARVQGGCEFGPRALGHRSILADPTFERMRDIINARVKFREPFRPFAPVIPEECAGTVFEQPVPSPFMLMVSRIRSEFHAKIPSVTHCDGTGRLQTVTAAENGYLHALCHRLAGRRDGPPVVLNTSFNVAGQPIVETPLEAIETFLSTDIDYLCVEGYWIARRDTPVLDYAAHLSRVEEGPMPRGLPSEQPAVDEEMEALDRALFFNAPPPPGWSRDALARLSSVIGLYREASGEHTASPLPAPSREWLPDGALLLLDPLGESLLFSDARATEPMALTFVEVTWLAALLSRDANYAERLRIEARETPLRWRERLERLAARASQHLGVSIQSMATDPEDRQTIVKGERILEAFSDPAFQVEAALAPLRKLLEEAGYRSERIARALGVESVQQIEPTHLHYFDRYRLGESALDDLIRLFLLRAALPSERIERLFPEALKITLEALGLLRLRGDAWSSAVDLFEVDGMYFVTDHRYLLLEEDRFDEQPVMYIGLDSLGLAMAAPRHPAERLLDLCAGSGVQGIVASRYASQIVAVDLNPRAARFARFNAQLNGVRNYRMLLGDLYEAVAGERFDTILANPPFVPSPDESVRFRDGGVSGEAVLRRIVTGAADHLNEEGRLHVVTDLVNVPTYHEKLSRWWRGEAAHALLLHTAGRDEMLFSVPHVHRPFGQPLEAYHREIESWVDNFRGASLESVDFGYLMLHADGAGEGVEVVKRIIHSPRRPIHQEILRHQAQLRSIRRDETDGAFVVPRPDLRLTTDETFNGEASHSVRVEDHPYFTTYEVSAEIVHWLKAISGHPTTFQEARSQLGEALLTELIELGLVDLSENSHYEVGARERDYGNRRVVQDCTKKVVQQRQTKTTPTCLSSYIC